MKRSMSSNKHQQFFTPDDMGMIERVLAAAGFRKSEADTDTKSKSDAARFLAREFQRGVTSETDLTSALASYVTAQRLKQSSENVSRSD